MALAAAAGVTSAAALAGGRPPAQPAIAHLCCLPTPWGPPPALARLAACRRRLTPQPTKVRADVEMTCFSYDGVEKIKEAMRAAQVRAGVAT